MLGYFDNAASEDEIPDDKIWHHPERLEEWFAAVKQRRESGMEPIDEGEETDMTRNAYLDELTGASSGH